MRRLGVAAALAVVSSACSVGFEVDSKRYACAFDSDCGPGFLCGANDVCVSAGAGGGPGGGGAAGGGGGTGGGDALCTVSSVAPLAAAVGETVTISGGGVITMTGVSFGGGPIAATDVQGLTSVTAVVPQGSASGEVVLSSPLGPGCAFPGFVLARPPSLTRVVPMTQGAGGLVIIAGQGLSNASSVTFGNQVAATILRNTDTSLLVAVPVGAASGTLTVTTPRGTDTQDGFVYVPPPIITAVAAPANGASVSGCVPVTFTLAQPTPPMSGAPRADVVVEFDATGTGAFSAATRCTQSRTGSAGLTRLLPGTHTFSWNTTADLSGLRFTNVALRVRATRHRVFGAQAGTVTGLEVVNTLSVATVGAPSVGAAPRGAVAGDFNRDGLADVAVVNTGDSTVSVLFGGGDGGFTRTAAFPVAAGPGLGAGDLDRDGVTDLVVASSTGVAVLLGTLDAGFQAPVVTTTGAPTRAVVVADVTADGVPDIVASNTAAAW